MCGEILSGKKLFTLEIGCGHGHYLIEYAHSKQDRIFIGIDLITKRIERANHKKEKRNIGNVFFLKAEAKEFMESISIGVKIEETILIFPDPWPKKRHNKNRIIQNSFLDKLAELTIQNGLLFFRTDDEDYYQWTADRVGKNPAWKIKNENVWPLEVETYFSKIMQRHKSIIAERV